MLIFSSQLEDTINHKFYASTQLNSSFMFLGDKQNQPMNALKTDKIGKKLKKINNGNAQKYR